MKTISLITYEVIVCKQVMHKCISRTQSVPLACLAVMRIPVDQQQSFLREMHWILTLPASCSERKCYRRCPLITRCTGGTQGRRQRKRRRSSSLFKNVRQKESVELYFVWQIFFRSLQKAKREVTEDTIMRRRRRRTSVKCLL